MAEVQYAHVEKMAVAWLTARNGGPVFTETDTELEANLPASKVEVAGGSSARIDRTVIVEVDSFAATRAGAWELAAKNDQAMLALAANGTSEWYVDEVRCTFHPTIEPYTNPEIRRATAMYELTIRPL